MKCILLYFVAIVTACAAEDLGHVENFVISDVGQGYVELSWDFVEGNSSYPLHKYSLTTDSDLTTQFKCTSPTCSRIVDYLDACVEHVFDLTPIFSTPTDDEMEGTPVTTTGYTTDDLPGAVSNIQVTADTDDGTSLKWDPPTENTECVDAYDVCFRLIGDSETRCVETNSAIVTMKDLSACATYEVTVTPLTPSDLQGEPLKIDITTRDGVPGEPQNVEVGLVTPETIQLLWDDPIVNPLCLDKFLIYIGETTTRIVKPAQGKTHDHQFTFSPLFPCANYTIDICSANAAEETSDKVIRHASTDQTNPLAPPTVTVTPDGPNSIEVNWGDNENDRCAGGFVVCWMDGVHPVEQCQEVGGGGDNSLIIHDLLPCSNYDVSVTVVSPDGTFESNVTTNSSSTPDVRPGPVVDLQVTDVSTDQLTVACQPPEVDPQCVKEVITRVINEDQKSLRAVKKTQFEETITGLQACTNYRVLVTTKSPSGLESEEREVSSKTLDDVPSEPQAFEVTEVTTTSITLQWFQPATNPNCAYEYILTWQDDTDSDTITLNDISTFKVLYTVEGLKPCTEHTFTIHAESPAGAGPNATVMYTTEC